MRSPCYYYTRLVGECARFYVVAEAPPPDHASIAETNLPHFGASTNDICAVIQLHFMHYTNNAPRGGKQCLRDCAVLLSSCT